MNSCIIRYFFYIPWHHIMDIPHSNYRSLGTGSSIPWILGYRLPPLFHLLHYLINTGSKGKLHSDYHRSVLQRCRNRSPHDIHKETLLGGKRYDKSFWVEITKCYNHRSLTHWELAKLSTYDHWPGHGRELHTRKSQIDSHVTLSYWLSSVILGDTA